MIAFAYRRDARDSTSDRIQLAPPCLSLLLAIDTLVRGTRTNKCPGKLCSPGGDRTVPDFPESKVERCHFSRVDSSKNLERGWDHRPRQLPPTQTDDWACYCCQSRLRWWYPSQYANANSLGAPSPTPPHRHFLLTWYDYRASSFIHPPYTLYKRAHIPAPSSPMPILSRAAARIDLTRSAPHCITALRSTSKHLQPSSLSGEFVLEVDVSSSSPPPPLYSLI